MQALFRRAALIVVQWNKQQNFSTFIHVLFMLVSMHGFSFENSSLFKYTYKIGNAETTGSAWQDKEGIDWYLAVFLRALQL